MPDALTCQAHAAAILAYVQCQYDRWETILDDCAFHQAATHLLEAIHAASRADNLPPDLTAAYQQLARLTRAQMMQRVVLPNRPLF